MQPDEVMAEVWKNREAVAARHHHNLHKIVVAMQKRQQHPLTGIVDRRHQTKPTLECHETPRS